MVPAGAFSTGFTSPWARAPRRGLKRASTKPAAGRARSGSKSRARPASPPPAARRPPSGGQGPALSFLLHTGLSSAPTSTEKYSVPARRGGGRVIHPRGGAGSGRAARRVNIESSPRRRRKRDAPGVALAGEAAEDKLAEDEAPGRSGPLPGWRRGQGAGHFLLRGPPREQDGAAACFAAPEKARPGRRRRPRARPLSLAPRAGLPLGGGGARGPPAPARGWSARPRGLASE